MKRQATAGTDYTTETYDFVKLPKIPPKLSASHGFCSQVSVETEPVIVILLTDEKLLT